LIAHAISSFRKATNSFPIGVVGIKATFSQLVSCFAKPYACRELKRLNSSISLTGSLVAEHCFALTLIQDLGSVMVMDGEDHRRRKEMFLSLMSSEAIARLVERTGFYWRNSVRKWEGKRQVVLLHEAYVPLCAAICEWVGLRLSDRTIRRRAAEFEAMIEGTGAIGPRNWKGHWRRARTERWMQRIVRRTRSGKMQVPEASAVYLISTFQDNNGRLLDEKSAAVELINILRPTVANARYIVFAAMALQAHPEWQTKLRTSDGELDLFVNEIRRYYPFIPLIGGRVLSEFTWRNYTFRKKDWGAF
jgi:fatty-acid peroxygenase